MDDPMDWQLVVLVETINRQADAVVGVTFCVGGQVVTGMLISATEYFRRQAEVFGDVPGFAALFTSVADEMQTENLDPEPETEPLPAAFVHLRDAQYVIGGTFIPATPGMLWRGRMSSVDGMSIGSLGPPK